MRTAKKEKETVNILFPGRHHMLTKFQFEYLRGLAQKGWNGKKIGTVIFAVTSANHENTRRNPIQLYLRTLAIDQFARDLSCEVKIFPIPDVRQTDAFARYLLAQISHQSGLELSPENTVLACSTPNIIRLFKKLGFQNTLVELTNESPETYSALRPFEVIDLLVRTGVSWRRKDSEWKTYAHGATQKLYERYNLGDSIIELFNDCLLGEDADITETRNYATYAQSMDNVIQLKFEDIKPFVAQGKIVDVGCSTGSLIQLLAREFTESDIIGIEAVRTFYEYCRSQEYAHPFVFFYRRNITDQHFKNNSINTFIYSSVTHEIFSYLGEDVLKKVLADAYRQLEFFGRLIIRDVVGPEEPDKVVCMELDQNDGQSGTGIADLSTYQKFFQFAREFKPRKISFEELEVSGKKFIQLRLQDAYEYMSKMTYTDNWDSELHEEFGFYSFSRWKEELEKAGFHIVDGSRAFHNPYIVEKKYAGRVALYVLKDGALVPEAYPPTNMILVGEK